jgi:plastocyanin
VRRWGLPKGVSLAVAALFAVALVAAPAASAERILKAVKDYPGLTTFRCHSDPITIYPGQNSNDLAFTQTCPNATKVGNGPVSTDVFAPGSTTEGFITRFKPSMVEVHPDGSRTVPPVWDLHLHHVVWLGPNGETFGAGEEKTISKLPRGYGDKVSGGGNWAVNQMIHSLNASEGRTVELTWEIDWVPEGAGLTPLRGQWMDVAGTPQIYPVFDAKRAFDSNGDGLYVFPNEVPTDPSAPGYSEREKISPDRRWVIPEGGATLVTTGGHLHPGGKRTNMQVARDGADAGATAGDDPSEVKQLFQSDARYYEPAGAVSWDVSMEVTRPGWRISLEEGDVVSINVTYNVKRGDWIESMGIMTTGWVPGHPDPRARDPFDDAAEVEAMFEKGGILTHGHLPENRDSKARKELNLPDPRKLPAQGPVPAGGIDIDSFVYSPGGFSAVRNFPQELMRPVLVDPGESVAFTNNDALPGTPNSEQVWHSITSCEAPCNKGSGIGYPLAAGPIRFDSGQLGFGQGLSREVTTGSNEYTSPPFTKAGKTYTYFCRIHPFMRGSVRVRDEKK